MPYIQKQHQADVLNFKYKGSGLSLTYQYIWSPFAEFILKYVPTTIAPNTITLVAFLVIVVSHLIFIFYDQSSITSAPQPWKYLLFAVALFIYQHLDNLDGKQARKTKNSSPIGMLFDHGADAISSMLVAFQIIKTIQCQDIELSFYFITGIIMLPNFLAIWAQYGTGAFHFDRINPIDEGLPLYQLLALVGYFIDYSFWKQHHWFASYNFQFLIIFQVVVVFVCFKMCKNVLKQTQRGKQDMLQKFGLPLILISILLLIKMLDLADIFYNQHPYLWFYILAFFWTRNQIYMQICSVTNQKFTVLNFGTIFFIVSTLIPLIYSPIHEHISIYLLIVMIIQLLFLTELIYSFLLQASTILNIKVFRVKPIEQQKQN